MTWLGWRNQRSACSPTTIAGNLGDARLGLSVSPDGSSILYTRLDASGDDLMLVENFR